MSDTNKHDPSLAAEAGSGPLEAAAGLSATVPPGMRGLRLDQALELLLPGSGLRERKRVWERFAVLVDGRPRPKGYRVQAGQILGLVPLEDAPGPAVGALPEGLRVVGQSTGRMAALFKPAGLHSAAVAGRPGPSVEASLPLFWPGRFARLVNRLDQATSGLVLAALSRESWAAYRVLEDEGRVEKAYVALVRGELARPLVLARTLDTADRKRVRVLAAESADPLRRTRVEPLAALPEQGLTLVRARIAKGARHQIRAHLAAAGLPIVGDDLYGGPEESGAGGLRLHHFRVTLPDFQASAPPLWPEWEGLGIGSDAV